MLSRHLVRTDCLSSRELGFSKKPSFPFANCFLYDLESTGHAERMIHVNAGTFPPLTKVSSEGDVNLLSCQHNSLQYFYHSFSWLYQQRALIRLETVVRFDKPIFCATTHQSQKQVPRYVRGCKTYSAATLWIIRGGIMGSKPTHWFIVGASPEFI